MASDAIEYSLLEEAWFISTPRLHTTHADTLKTLSQ